MYTLGRMLLFWILYSTLLNALTLTITPKRVVQGDRVRLTIGAKGSHVSFPKIKRIGTSPVLDQSLNQKITMERGKIFKTFVKTYIFEANSSFTLPPIAVEVDGKTERTPTRTIIVHPADKSGGAMRFWVEADKKEAYVGEPIPVRFTFVQKLDLKVVEANFTPPPFKDFWAKETRKLPRRIEGDKVIYTITYLLTAKHAGTLTLEPAKMDVGLMRTTKRDYYSFERVKWKSLYTKALKLKIDPLPEGITLFGHYTMHAKTDTNTTDADRPVNFTLSIVGKGNLDSLGDFSLKIPDATVYADTAKSVKRADGIHFTQHFAILCDHDYTIPPLKLRYFDDTTHTIRTLSTAPIAIHVRSAAHKNEKAAIQLASEPSDRRGRFNGNFDIKSLLALTLLGGIMLGMGVMWLIVRRRTRAHRTHPKAPSPREAIRAAKTDKELLARLLAYTGSSPELDRIIEKLEENLYGGARHHIDPKKVAKALPDLLHPPRKEEILR